MNTTKPLILAIDNGTQSVRALLFDTQATSSARANRRLNPTSPSSRAGRNNIRSTFGKTSVKRANCSGKTPMHCRLKWPG